MSAVSVLTAALPSRLAMLGDACASVRAQRHPAAEHLIGVDYDRRGSSAVRNDLLAAANGSWVAVLDDDDVLLPNHLEALIAASADADVVYSFCQVTGRPDGWTPNREFDADALREGNFIPVTALIRRSLLDELGGWRNSADCLYGFEDWRLWLDALDAGARFVCVPEVTWVYRFGSTNKTFVGEKAAF